jgi:hypothetical protein
MTASAGNVHRLACLELHGGNRLARYAARLPGLTAWVCCNPLEPSRRGGDLYYLSACSHGSIARVVIADVSGHGEKVSAAAARLETALRPRRLDKQFVLFGVSTAVEEVFRLTHVIRIFRIVESEQEALGGV